MKNNKFFLLSWRKIWLIIVISFLLIIIHNLIYLFFKLDETFLLFIIAVLIPAYFILCIVYSIIWLIEKVNKIKK